ncbi:MAG: DUF6285 domain-containing protein [Polyangiaceae bacterium]
MQDRPTTRELVEAARELFQEEVLPTVTDPRLKFRILVALNALGIAEREMFAGDVLLDEELKGLLALLGDDRPIPESRLSKEALGWKLRKDLSALIREGRAPEGTGAFLKASMGFKLSVASPRFLGRVG